MKNIYDEDFEKDDDVYVNTHHVNKESLKVFFVVIFAFAIVAFCIFIAYTLNTYDENSATLTLEKVDDSNFAEVLNEEFDASQVKKIDLNIGRCNFAIVESEDDKITLSIYGNEGDEEAYNIALLHNDTLSIDENSKSSYLIWLGDNGHIITLYVPKKFNGEINSKIDVGNILAGDFENASMNFELNVGDVFVKSAKSINAEVDCGNLECKNVESLFAKVNVGDIFVNSVSSSLDLYADYGNVTIDKVSLQSDSKIECDCGNIEIQNAGNTKIFTDCSLGDVSVENMPQEGMHTLTITADCGDITVK